MKRVILGLLLLAGCGTPGTVDSTVEPLGATNDRADRACQVLMRNAYRLIDARGVGFGVVVELGATLTAQGATPFVLYQSSDGGGWQEVQAYDGTARFLSQGDAQATAFAKLPDGSRVFDHNRFPGDFETAHLVAQTGWSAGDDPLCTGPQPHGTLDFQLGWTTVQRGPIVRGGKLDISYALDRLTTCRDTHNGYRFWTMDAFVRFSPGGQTVSGTVVASNGFDIFPTVYSTDVPRDADSVEIWFRNASVPSCEGFDSNWGQNYRFRVVPVAPSRIVWAGDEGSSVDRACQHQAGVPDPIVIDEYVRERACVFTDEDVWAPGVTDGSTPHPEWIFARVELSKDGQAPTTAWLEPQGRVGNNERFRYSAPYEIRNQADWTTAAYTFEFSTDGNTWLTGATHHYQRAFVLP